MNPFTPKRMSWAGLLASGLTIVTGLVLSVTVVFVFSDSPARDLSLVAIVFGIIMFFPVWALRTPPPPAPNQQKARRWRWPWWRKRRRSQLAQRYWKRKRGQSQHRPFGTPELPRPSTFVRAPRKPTEP